MVNRLAGSKKNTQRWIELAEALEEFWDSYYLPNVEQLEDARSLFTASPADLDLRLQDMGDFFDVTLPVSEDSKPLAVVFRRDEIRYKDTALPITSIIKRNFKGLDTDWLPLFTRKDGVYSEGKLYTEQELNDRGEDLDDYYMTSRGTLWVDEGHLRRTEYTRNEFSAITRNEIEKVRPVHIVFGGIMFVLTIRFDMKPSSFSSTPITTKRAQITFTSQRETYCKGQFTLPRVYNVPALTHYSDNEYASFDAVPADFMELDKSFPV